MNADPAGTFPVFTIGLREAETFPVEDRHLEKLGAANLRFDEAVPEMARRFCRVYEGILRRMFRECTDFTNHIHVRDGVVHLNAIDNMSSALIVGFLSGPSPSAWARLEHILRVKYAAAADVIALIVCRNLGVRARRLGSDEQIAAYWKVLTDTPAVLEMPGGPPSELELLGRSAEYVLVDGPRPFVIYGQMSPWSSATAQSLLLEKSRASSFLRMHGHRVPEQVLVPDEQALNRVRRFETAIFKPTYGSNRKAVVGPVQTSDRERTLQCYRRCCAQKGRGVAVIAEEYVHGTHFRINVNHGRVTFVARSIRNEVVGDGRSTIAELLAARRVRAGSMSHHSDTYIENVICGRGLGVGDILAPDERVTLSHDGNEGGALLDVTDTFPSQWSAEALAVAATCRCPVMGIDAVADSADRLWILDVNATRPAVSLFGDLSRAYDTMTHMIRTLLIDARVAEGCGA